MPPHHAPRPQAESQHSGIRAEIERHPAVQDRHFINEPIVEPEKGQSSDGVDEEGRLRPPTKPHEQPAKHCLCAKAADEKRDQALGMGGLHGAGDSRDPAMSILRPKTIDSPSVFCFSMFKQGRRHNWGIISGA
jgi:hypothetical protein